MLQMYEPCKKVYSCAQNKRTIMKKVFGELKKMTKF